MLACSGAINNLFYFFSLNLSDGSITQIGDFFTLPSGSGFTGAGMLERNGVIYVGLTFKCE